MPYAIYENGIVWGSVLVLAGGLLSFTSGSMIVACCERTKTARLEDLARAAYGQKMATYTSIVNLLCLCSFTVSYIVFVKQTIP